MFRTLNTATEVPWKSGTHNSKCDETSEKNEAHQGDVHDSESKRNG